MKEFELFEVSWEVCNKVGGIYTVVKSKAGVVENKLHRAYFLVGPWFSEGNAKEFEEKLPSGQLKEIFFQLKNEGIICHFGRWKTYGNPNCILIDSGNYSYTANEIKKKFWECFKIDSINSDFYDYDKPIVWGCAVGRFIELYRKTAPEKNLILHCHEWLAAGALLYTKANSVKVKTVFTTHATVLGRSLAGDGRDFYHEIHKIMPDEEAYKLGVHTKHQTEKAAALSSNVFTTVSEITGLEAEHFLSRKPDVIVPNGLDLERFPTFEEASSQHRLFKARMKEFATYFFMPYYSFDINKTLFFFTACRYEFHGKGLDVLIDSLAYLDAKLKKDKSNTTIITFFFVPMEHQGVHMDLFESKTFFEDVKESITINDHQILNSILTRMITDEHFTERNIFLPAELEELHGKIISFKRKSEPLLCTHEINLANNPVIKRLSEKGLTNSKANRVKVILYPIYLTGADSLLDLNYYETIIGSHLGIFPSYYEPWGYTPLETISNGVVSMTTDITGFGRYLHSNFKKEDMKGICVIPRMGVPDQEFSNVLGEELYTFTNLTKRQRIEKKISAAALSENFDWKNLIRYYFNAYSMAIGD